MSQPFAHLMETFRRSELLPQLPEPAMRLIQTLERPEASVRDLERVIASDAALAAALLRAASSATFGGCARPTTISGAIMRLGHGTVRNLALSFSLQAMLSRPSRKCSFDARRWARHSLYVGARARSAFADSAAEEAFAAGLVHDLAPALLARVAPDAYDLTARVAAEKGWRLDAAFAAIFSGSLSDLGVSAARAWRLPPLFESAIGLRRQPADEQPWEALREADAAATEYGFALETWLPASEAPEEEQPIALTVESLLQEAFGAAA